MPGSAPSTCFASLLLHSGDSWPRTFKNGRFTPPTYSHIYKLKTVQQSNDKGTWFGWDVSRVGPIADAGIYKIAKDFGANVSKGDVKVKHGDQESKSEAPY